MPQLSASYVDWSGHHIFKPQNVRHWFGFIKNFSILFPNHNPFPNFSITHSLESSVNEVTTVQICTLICSTYSRRNGDTVHSSKVNDIGQMLASKQ